MKYYRCLLIVVWSNQSPPSIEEVHGYKYPQRGLICVKQNLAKKESQH